jgi:hypothetical protein
MINNSQDDYANQLKAENLAIEQAVREAVLLHKRLGLPMVEWHDGQIVWVPADQLDLDDDLSRQ